MTYFQSFIAGFIFGTLLLVGFCGSPLHAESQPPTPEGRALQHEMDAYVQMFTKQVGITSTSMQWDVMILPILEMDSPAVTYGWALPPPSVGPTQVWIGLFTFHRDWMLMLEPNQRRAVAGHEVAHMTNECMSFRAPDTTGMHPMEEAIAEFNHLLLVESCADILSAELTSIEDVLSTLIFFRNEAYKGNPLLIQRIRVIQRLQAREAQNVE